ncbi:unnamed protein product [Pleuronectes platessa]|uniref:Uncharacterized protein n=1 Tax=Pleuronectes platessa TaxID=8262 RepID=A0A9N7UGU7_PLEPL|nr:unnamed protein product [Pleuronectes platessa]
MSSFTPYVDTSQKEAGTNPQGSGEEALLEGGLQRFCLSATVSGHHSARQCGRMRGSLVETEGAREGAEWRRSRYRPTAKTPPCTAPLSSVLLSPSVTLPPLIHLSPFHPASLIDPLCPSPHL